MSNKTPNSVICAARKRLHSVQTEAIYYKERINMYHEDWNKELLETNMEIKELEDWLEENKC